MNTNKIINEIADRTEHVVSDLMRRGTDWIEEAELDTRVRELTDKTERLVKEHPLESVAVGALLGFLIGRIFLRR